MKLIVNFHQLILGLLLAISMISCERKVIKKNKLKKVPQTIVCNNKGFDFQRKTSSFTEKELSVVLKTITSIDNQVSNKHLNITKKINNNFSNYLIYSSLSVKVKIISEIYVSRLKLASIKHEVYFIDNCNIISKMTKYAYRSKRIKAIYYYSFHDGDYLGCFVEPNYTFFRKKDKWLNISNEKVAIDWSKRIYNNIIKPELSGL